MDAAARRLTLPADKREMQLPQDVVTFTVRLSRDSRMFQYIQYSDKIKAINRKNKYLFKEKIFVKKLLFYIN